MRPSLSGTQRLVVKLGTNLLTGGSASFRDQIAINLVEQIDALRQKNIQVILVSSGAIGLGARKLRITGRISQVAMRQACAAVGQPLLMQQYNQLFEKYDTSTAQVLLTRELLNHRESFLNIQATIEHLLQMNIVPICNENDSVSIAEIGPVFGDNDNLSAHIASKLDADLLVLLTDIDALYTADPKKDKNAQAVRLVKKITPDLLKTASGSGSESGTGGMRTKLEAVQTAARAGTHVVIADGSQPDILLRMIKDEEVGTLFLSGPRLKSRHRWILNSAPKGSITVDQGAEKALCDGKSLLPKGVTAVKGSFHSGDVIAINDRFHAISRLDSSQIQKIMGVHSKEAAKILGCDTDVVAQAEDIVIKKPIEDEG